jgi:hypothetical protein
MIYVSTASVITMTTTACGVFIWFYLATSKLELQMASIGFEVPEVMRDYYAVILLTGAIVMFIITITLCVGAYVFRQQIHVTVRAFQETAEYSRVILGLSSQFPQQLHIRFSTAS